MRYVLTGTEEYTVQVEAGVDALLCFILCAVFDKLFNEF